MHLQSCMHVQVLPVSKLRLGRPTRPATCPWQHNALVDGIVFLHLLFDHLNNVAALDHVVYLLCDVSSDSAHAALVTSTVIAATLVVSPSLHPLLTCACHVLCLQIFAEEEDTAEELALMAGADDPSIDAEAFEAYLATVGLGRRD